MADFLGYLLKFGDIPLSNEFILADGWNATPNHRLEQEAYRNENADLIRITSPNHKTEIQITLPKMNLAKKKRLQAIINAATIDKDQRKVEVTYWNDEEEKYKTGEFYLPDIKYNIHTVNEDARDIEYKSMQIKLIQY